MFSSFTVLLARSPWYPFPFPPRAVLTFIVPSLRTDTLSRVVANLFFADVVRAVYSALASCPIPLPLPVTTPPPFHDSLLPLSVSSLPTACDLVPSFPLPVASCLPPRLWSTLAPPSHPAILPPHLPCLAVLLSTLANVFPFHYAPDRAGHTRWLLDSSP